MALVQWCSGFLCLISPNTLFLRCYRSQKGIDDLTIFEKMLSFLLLAFSFVRLKKA